MMPIALAWHYHTRNTEPRVTRVLMCLNHTKNTKPQVRKRTGSTHYGLKTVPVKKSPHNPSINRHAYKHKWDLSM